MSIQDIEKLDRYAYKFDIYIQSTNGEFELTSYQCAFEYLCNDMLSDNFTFTYLSGSSELSNKPVFGVANTTSDGHNELTFASNAGNDLIKSKPIKVGTFMLKRKNNFEENSFKIDWNFEGVNSTILTGKDYANITFPGNFTSPFTLTGLDDQDKQVISDYQLFQNYPNPFNPTTKIRYSVPAFLNSSKGGTLIQLKVYDIIGKEIATLVNKEQPAGNYEVKFDGSNFASGVYFFRLSAGDFVQTKKMILTK